MSDEIDMGCEMEQRDRDLCIAVARQQAAQRELPATGRCHNCLDDVAEGERYCDAGCRDDHQSRVAAEKRRGRVMQ